MFSTKFILVSTRIFFLLSQYLISYFTFALNPLKSNDTNTNDAINRFFLKNVLWPIWPTDDFMFLALSVKFFFLQNIQKMFIIWKIPNFNNHNFFYFPQLQTENENYLLFHFFVNRKKRVLIN